MDFGGDVGQGPATGEVGGEEKLDAIDNAFVTVGAGGVASGARSECALDESNGEALGFEVFGDTFAETVAKHGDECLCTCVDAEALGTEPRFGFGGEKRWRRDLREKCGIYDEREAGVAAGDRMTHVVAFPSIEKENLVSFSDRLIVTNVPNVCAPVSEDERGDACVFFGGAVAAGSAAIDITDGDDGGVQKEIGGDLGT